jgi:hypothetical protein
MSYKYYLPLCVASLFSAGCISVLGQASIVENQAVLLYVSAASGSNANPGTQALPLQTINAAIAKANAYASKNIGVKVEVEPGTYHEYVQLGWSRYNPTLTIEATQTGQAVVDAADVVTGWTAATGGKYWHAFPSLGSNPVPPGWPYSLPAVVYRREMAFVDGRRFEQVMNWNDMVPGTFYVNDSDHHVNIFPLPGTNMQTATVEVSTRPYTFQSHSRSNFVLRGLVFEHAATVMNQESAMVEGGSNILVDSIETHDNNWGGFGFHGTSNVTLQNSFAHQNGALGFATSFSRNVLARKDEADYNNWRGEQGAFYDFAMGGYKFFATHGATVDGLVAYNNGGEGLWFDTDNRQVTVDSSTLSGNYDTNLQVELNVGPITVQNTAFCYGTIGANLVNSEYVTFANNTFVGNSDPTQSLTKAQFYLAGAPGGRHFTDWETGEYHNVVSQQVTLSQNRFMDVGPNQKLFYTYLGGADLATFQSSFQSTGNTWFDGMQPASFGISGKWYSLSQWQSFMMADSTSMWLPTGAPRLCYSLSYSTPDFEIFTPTNHMWATAAARNGVATIPVYVKNFATAAPIALRVLPQRGISSQLAVSVLAASMPGQYAGGITNLVVSSTEKGTFTVTIQGTSAGHVHTLAIPVTF